MHHASCKTARTHTGSHDTRTPTDARRPRLETHHLRLTPRVPGDEPPPTCAHANTCSVAHSTAASQRRETRDSPKRGSARGVLLQAVAGRSLAGSKPIAAALQRAVAPMTQHSSRQQVCSEPRSSVCEPSHAWCARRRRRKRSTGGRHCPRLRASLTSPSSAITALTWRCPPSHPAHPSCGRRPTAQNKPLPPLSPVL